MLTVYMYDGTKLNRDRDINIAYFDPCDKSILLFGLLWESHGNKSK